jgi:hypothetical protein
MRVVMEEVPGQAELTAGPESKKTQITTPKYNTVDSPYRKISQQFFPRPFAMKRHEQRVRQRRLHAGLCALTVSWTL